MLLDTTCKSQIIIIHIHPVSFSSVFGSSAVQDPAAGSINNAQGWFCGCHWPVAVASLASSHWLQHLYLMILLDCYITMRRLMRAFVQMPEPTDFIRTAEVKRNGFMVTNKWKSRKKPLVGAKTRARDVPQPQRWTVGDCWWWDHRGRGGDYQRVRCKLSTMCNPANKTKVWLNTNTVARVIMS